MISKSRVTNRAMCWRHPRGSMSHQRAMAERQATPDSTHKWGFDATSLNPHITSPHISGKVVSLSLSDNDRTLLLTKVQRLEAVLLVVHMEGSRPNRPELRQMLYVT